MDAPPNSFAWPARGGLGDAAVTGRVRCDAMLRWLQDAAHRHVLGLGHGGEPWVVRRCVLDVVRFPVHDEAITVTTWCSGLARLWAQRETTIAGEHGAAVRATAIWVHLDAAGRPRPLSDSYREALGVPPDAERVRARLHHPAPPDDAPRRPWTFRVSDLDMADHVNNAAYWSVVEEELREWPADRPLRVEVEHPAAGATGPAEVAADGAHRWVLDASGVVSASFHAPALG